MPRQTFGTPTVQGTTVEEVRRNTQFWLQYLMDKLDELAGLRGNSAFYGDVNMQGRRVRNLGEPVDPTDAVPAQSALTKELDPSTGRTHWNAGNLQMLNLEAAAQATQAVNLQQLKDEIAAAGTGLIPYGTIVLWYGSAASVPGGWHVCDGTAGTPDLRDRFVVGAGSTYAVNATGGATTINIAHTHTADGTLAAASNGAHTHADGTLATATPSATTTVDNNADGTTVSVGSDTHTHDVTGSTASDGAHTHDVTGDTSSALSATQSVLNPYWALLYIMKV